MRLQLPEFACPGYRSDRSSRCFLWFRVRRLLAHGGRGDIVEFALVVGLLFFLLFGGFSLMQIIQVRAAVEAAAREAARYVAANVVYNGSTLTLPPDVVSNAEARARDVVRSSVSKWLLQDPLQPEPYDSNTNVSVSLVVVSPDKVRANVVCYINPVTVIRPGARRPEQALGPPQQAVAVGEGCTFRVPHIITSSDPTG